MRALKVKSLIAFTLALFLLMPPVFADVSLTVYQRDLVLIRDTRTVDLERGKNSVVFDAIAPGILEATLRISPQGNPADIKVIEQSYEYDLADQDRIWRKYLNKPFQFTKDDSLYVGTLLNFDEDFIYLEPADQPGAVAMIDRSGVEDMTFDALPQGLVLHPEILWIVESGKKRSNFDVEISYLAEGMTWQADYTALLIKSDRVRLEGNVILDNTLDIEFENAQVDLIAGDLHRADDSRQLGVEDAFGEPGKDAKDEGVRFFEYRHYQLPEATTLHASQTKGLPLIGPVEVSCEESFFYDGSSSEEEVLIRLLFNNEKSAGLGLALPEGNLLLYKEDAKGKVHFLGEDHLEASSPGDEVELIIGKAFDLRVDRKRISHQRISRNRTRDTLEITFASSRTESSKITVRERLYGFWEIIESTWGDDPVSHRVVHANKVEFDLQLAPGASRTLRYIVEYGY